MPRIPTILLVLALASPVDAADKTVGDVRKTPPDFFEGYVTGATHTLLGSIIRCRDDVSASMVQAALDTTPRRYEGMDAVGAVTVILLRLGCEVDKVSLEKLGRSVKP